MESLFQSEVDVISKELDGWNLNGHGMGLQGKYISEMLHHYVFASKKLESFVGRDDISSECMNLIYKQVEPIEEVDNNNNNSNNNNNNNNKNNNNSRYDFMLANPRFNVK